MARKLSSKSQLIPTIFENSESKYKMGLRLQFFECRDVGFQVSTDCSVERNYNEGWNY